MKKYKGETKRADLVKMDEKIVKFQEKVGLFLKMCYTERNIFKNGRVSPVERGSK